MFFKINTLYEPELRGLYQELSIIYNGYSTTILVE